MKVVCTIKKVINDSSTRYFLFPQNVVHENGRLEEVNKGDYPNSGSVWISTETQKIDYWIDRAVILDTDKMEETASYDINHPKSCKFVLKNLQGLSYPGEDEFVEIITLSKEQLKTILENEEKRILELPVMPLNKKIILADDAYAYGMFEYEILGNDTDSNMIKIRILTKPLTNGYPEYHIKKYKTEDLLAFSWEINIYPENRSLEPLNKTYIYSSKLIDEIEVIHTIDFIEDKVLINQLKEIISNEENIDFTRNNIQLLKRTLKDMNHINLEFKEERIYRLSNREETAKELIEYKTMFMEKFFTSSISDKYKKEYLESNPDIIADIAKRDVQYNIKKQELQQELKDLENNIEQHENILSNIKNEIHMLRTKKEQYDSQMIQHTLESQNEEVAVAKENLENISKEIKRKEEEMEIKQKKIEQIENKYELVTEYDKLVKEIEGKNYVLKELEKTEGALKNNLEKLSSEYEKVEEVIASKYKEKIEKSLTDSLMNLFTKKTIDIKPTYEPINEDNLISDFDEFKERLINTFKKYNRKISEDEILNYLICLTQGFITVFAGNPGVGKTSMCDLLATGLGIKNDRFCKVSVERGWTSSSDLIGYYNPLTKEFQKSATGVYNALVKVNEERKHKENRLPYLILLDEANLSAIEYYWSKFMTISDNPLNGAIDIGESHPLKVTEGFKFLSTINFDHTTEPLSPRFLDRAWVIKMDKDDDVFAQQILSEMLEDTNEGIVNYEMLKENLMPKESDELKEHLDFSMNEILKTLKQNNKSISPRSLISIQNYCLVAQKYMTGNNRHKPLDYALAQKLIPQINGVGSSYKKFLSELNDICRKYSLITCSRLLEEIIQKGEREHDYYQFFSK